MSIDNYREKVDDYHRYQDYKYDQRALQQELSLRRAEVYDAIRRQEYDRAAWALRIPGHLTAASGVEADLYEPQDHSLAKQTQALIRDINDSAYISNSLQSNWIAGLEALPEINTKDALDRIVDFKIAFSAWNLKNRPQENLWDVGNSKIWLFDSQILLIECKVDRIRWHLESELRNNR